MFRKVDARYVNEFEKNKHEKTRLFCYPFFIYRLVDIAIFIEYADDIKI